MIGDIKFDRHRLKHAQMVRAPTPNTDEKNPFHLFFTGNSEKTDRLWSRLDSRNQRISDVGGRISDRDSCGL
jgi:hypothetical protein